MATALYPNFLNDPSDYVKAEALWQGRWTDLLRRFGQEQSWKTPWINTHFANGSPSRDGNPIFSAICPVRRLGVRVIQIDDAEAPHEVSSWTDTFADGGDTVNELVISCALTEASLHEAMKLIEAFITRER